MATNPDGTGKVSLNSPLKRKAWVVEGLLQQNAKSFWAPYKGKTIESIITIQNDTNAKEGHTVVFDFDGNLTGKAVKGNKTAKGTGEQKKKFSDTLVVSDYRYVVDNGTRFDGVDIGDLTINSHEDSRSKLADLWVRSDDQAYFDLAQQAAQFGLEFTKDKFDLNALGQIEAAVKTGEGFNKKPIKITRRAPLAPFRLENGEPIWLFVIDVKMKQAFLKNSTTPLSSADLRGNDNRLLKGVVGKIGSFVIVEAPVFFGETDGRILKNGYYAYENTSVEIAGLRQYDKANQKWSGQSGFSSPTVSRGVVLGAGALQKGNGMMPDYKYEETDFGKFSESCLEVWCSTKATELHAENSDYKSGQVSGYNYGLVYVDVDFS